MMTPRDDAESVVLHTHHSRLDADRVTDDGYTVHAHEYRAGDRDGYSVRRPDRSMLGTFGTLAEVRRRIAEDRLCVACHSIDPESSDRPGVCAECRSEGGTGTD